MTVQFVNSTEFAKQYTKLAKNSAKVSVVVTENNQPDQILIKVEDLGNMVKKLTKVVDQLKKDRIRKAHEAFVEETLAAENEPDVGVWETEEDVHNFFEKYRKERLAKEAKK